jgi:hypothetical protein
MFRAGAIGTAFVLLSTFASGEGGAPPPYAPDMFEERDVDACAMAPVVGAFPIQGGRDWVFDGVGALTVIACDKLPSLKASPLPKSILRGTGLDNWRLGGDARPETVELRNGVPHRIVMAWAIGPKAKRKTTAPCYEPNPDVVCEGSEDGDFVRTARELEADLRRVEYFVGRRRFEEALTLGRARADALKSIVEGLRGLTKSSVVKTSEGGMQTKEAFENRILQDAQRLVDLMTRSRAALDGGAP